MLEKVTYIFIALISASIIAEALYSYKKGERVV